MDKLTNSYAATAELNPTQKNKNKMQTLRRSKVARTLGAFVATVSLTAGTIGVSEAVGSGEGHVQAQHQSVTNTTSPEQAIDPMATPEVQAAMVGSEVQAIIDYVSAVDRAEKIKEYTDLVNLQNYLTAIADAQFSAPQRQQTYTNIDAPAPVVADGSVWDQLAQCESGGNWAINTGNGFTGGLQFMDSTWLNEGGGAYAPSAYLASREQQIDIAERTQASGGWGQWPQCSAELGLR